MSPALSRLAALGLLLGLLAALGFGAVGPVLGTLGGLDARIAEQKAQLARFRDRLAQGRVRARIAVADRALLAAESPALAAAELRDILDRAVAAAGAELRSVTVEPSRPLAPGAAWVPLTVRLVSDMAGLETLLYRLETGEPYLVVEALDLRRARRGTGPDALAIRLEIAGIAAAPETASAR